MNKKNIYLDHAAATPFDSEVLCEMYVSMQSDFANPSALYADAVRTKEKIFAMRELIATALKTNPDTIIFTRGGTESINMAILGAARAYKNQGKHIISTKVEHSAVLNTLKQLEKEGFEITYVPVDETGQIALADVLAALRPDTILVSIMYVNNEIGTIYPIVELGKKILQWRKQNKTIFPIFHTDACQAMNSEIIAVDTLHVDLLSFNASKIYGPKSAGVLYKRRGTSLDPILFGGGHEFGLRPGTEDGASIVGMAKATEKAQTEKELYKEKTEALRNYFWDSIEKQIPLAEVNGPGVMSGDRVCNNLNVSFVGAEAEAIILYLDAVGIAVASGAACSADSDAPSHVLSACGLSTDRMKSSIRFTLGRDTTKKEIDTVMKVLPGIIERVRGMQKISS